MFTYEGFPIFNYFILDRIVPTELFITCSFYVLFVTGLTYAFNEKCCLGVFNCFVPLNRNRKFESFLW